MTAWQIDDGGSEPRRIVSAELEAPAFGAWTLRAVVSGADELGASVTCTLGASDWRGTVRAQRVDGGRRQVRIIGGAGGLGTAVPDRAEAGSGATVESVARALCALGGETLEAAPSTAVGSWARLRGTVGTSLTDLCRTMGLRWRVTAAGGVRVYAPESPEASPPGTLLERSDTAATFGVSTFGVEPPCTLDGLAVELVEAQVDEKGVARLTASTGSLADAWRAMGAGAGHARVLSGRVVSQAGRLVTVRLEVPSSAGFGPGGVGAAVGAWTIPNVPLWPGLPGVTLKLRPGAGVLVLFVDADPRRPVALPSPYGEKADEITLETEGGARLYMHGDVVEHGGDAYTMVRFEPLVAWLGAIVSGVVAAGGAVTPPTPFPTLDTIQASGPGRLG